VFVFEPCCLTHTAMLTVLLPRDAMFKRGLCCRPASVCPSVTLMDSIQTVEDIVILLVRPSGTITLVFGAMRRYPNLRETHSAGVTRGGENRRFSTETVRDRPMVSMER